RAEPLLDPCRSKPHAAVRCDTDRDQITILGVPRSVARDRKLAAELLLVDRHEATAAGRQRPEHAQHPGPGPADDLDDATAITNVAIVARFLDSKQRAIADACDLVRVRTARRAKPDFWQRPEFVVPFGRGGNQLAVAVAAGDVGERDGG